MKISITNLTGNAQVTLKADSSDAIENVNGNVSDGDAQLSVTTLAGKNFSFEVVNSDTTVPKVVTPDTTVPKVVNPNTTVSKVVTPDTTVPKVVNPDTTVSKVVTPDTTVPRVVNPDTTVPRVVNPDTTVPRVVNPDTTVPKVVTPDTTVPQVVNPDRRVLKGLSWTLESKKRKIQNKERITPKQRKAGKTLSDDTMLIYVYPVKGQTVSFEVKGSDTVENLKLKIQDKEGFRPEEQTLMYAGKELVNDSTLADCNVMNGCGIQFVYRDEMEMELLEDNEWSKVFIKPLTGKLIIVDVKGCHSIRFVKSMIHSMEGYPVNEQRLLYAGRQLEDGKTLTYYNIKQSSTLDFYLRH